MPGRPSTGDLTRDRSAGGNAGLGRALTPPPTVKPKVQRFTKDELIEVLRRNIPVHKDDERFAQYLIDVAAYLIEVRAQKREQEEKKLRRPGTPWPEKAPQPLPTRSIAEPVKNKAIHDSASKVGARDKCALCGAPAAVGQLMCPHCGSMVL